METLTQHSEIILSFDIAMTILIKDWSLLGATY